MLQTSTSTAGSTSNFTDATPNSDQPHSDSSSYASTADSSPFLNFTGELRNTVYAYASAETQKMVRWKLGCTYTDLALIVVCKQMRREFRPLFWRQVKFKVAIEDLPDLLATLLASDPGFRTVWKVKVGVSEDDLFSQASRDILALLCTIRQHRRVSWKSKLGGHVHHLYSETLRENFERGFG